MSKATREREQAERQGAAKRRLRTAALKVTALASCLALLGAIGSAMPPTAAEAKASLTAPAVPPPPAVPWAPAVPRAAESLASSRDSFYESPVEVFIGGERLWKTSTLGKALDGQLEFVHEGQLVDPSKVREFGGILNGVEGVTRDKIDICLEPPTRCPEQSDVVQVLDMAVDPPLGTHSHFVAVGNLVGGERVRFQYDVYDAAATGPTGLELRFVETQWGMVRRTWKSTTDTIVDLTYRAEDGKETTLSGTVEHPFFVPAADDFVPMAQLTPGTVLETDDGSVATVTSSSIRHGEFEVYGFDVEGHNTYFVGGSSDSPGVLVHNRSWLRPSGWRLPSKRYGGWANAKKVGDSDFILNRRTAKSLGLPDGTRVSFRQGVPDFRAFSHQQKNFRIPGLTGDHKVDDAIIARVMAGRMGTSQADYFRWLERSNLTPHHYKGNLVQFVNSDIHGTLRHSGGAVLLRMR